MGFFKQSWLVLMLALCFGGALAGVYVGLNPRIEQNKTEATEKQIPSLVKPLAGEMRFAKAKEVTYGGLRGYEAFDADGKRMGWVVKASGNGFGGKIELLVGLDADAKTVLGIYVLEQVETPGLGDKIKSDPQWSGQFRGHSATSNLAVVKKNIEDANVDNNEIAAVSGATVSSMAVTTIVNKAVIRWRNALIEAGTIQP